MSSIRAPRRYRYVTRTRSRARRSSRYASRRRRPKAKPKIGFETVIAAGMIPITGAQDGWSTPLGNAQAGDFVSLSNNLKSGFLGMKDAANFDLFALLNPFDMNCGRYLKMLLISAGIGKVRKKIMKLPKLPLIGRYVN